MSDWLRSQITWPDGWILPKHSPHSLIVVGVVLAHLAESIWQQFCQIVVLSRARLRLGRGTPLFAGMHGQDLLSFLRLHALQIHYFLLPLCVFRGALVAIWLCWRYIVCLVWLGKYLQIVYLSLELFKLLVNVWQVLHLGLDLIDTHEDLGIHPHHRPYCWCALRLVVLSQSWLILRPCFLGMDLCFVVSSICNCCG